MNTASNVWLQASNLPIVLFAFIMATDLCLLEYQAGINMNSACQDQVVKVMVDIS